MIYVYDNGGEYSDHWVAFIDSDLPREDMVKLFGEDKIVAAAMDMTWWHGEATRLGHVAEVQQFFSSVPLPAWFKGTSSGQTGADCVAATAESWANAQYRRGSSPPPDWDGGRSCWNVRDKAFARLTPASASRLLADYRCPSTQQVYPNIGDADSFEIECKKRGLLT